MALTLDATVGGTAANSYVTLAEAEAYLEARPGATAWTAAATAAKEQALVAATYRLDQERYGGERSTTTQARKWPRAYLYDDDGYDLDATLLPRELKDATCELALALLTDPSQLDAAGLAGFAGLSVGPISVQPRAASTAAPLPPAVVRLLARWRFGAGRIVRG